MYKHYTDTVLYMQAYNIYIMFINIIILLGITLESSKKSKPKTQKYHIKSKY